MDTTPLSSRHRPSDWVRRFAPLIRAEGRVLDLACGEGRHARFLAACGYQVEAIDRNAEVIAALAGVERVNARQADVEAGPWPFYGEAFDGIVVTNYLHRPLLPNLMAALGEDGVLIYETFMVGNERVGPPTDPAHLLRSGELLEVVGRRLAIVAFEQGEIDSPRPAVVQRICARRGTRLMLPGSPAPGA